MQKFLVTHKTTIIQGWYALLIGWFLFFLISIPLFPQVWYPLGLTSASISLVAFWLALTPGMLKRFGFGGIFLPIRTMMMLYRRQIGISMYVFALTHYWWVRMLPILSFGGNVLQFSRFELMGVAAFTLLTPVFFTSNEWSVRTLGRWWRRIHALVYIVVWLLFLHVGMQGSSWQASGTLVVAALETFSLLWAKMKSPPLVTVPQSQTPPPPTPPQS